MPRTAGNFFFTFPILKSSHEAQNQGLQKWPKFVSWAAPILIFVFLGGASGFCKEWDFQNRPNFAETTENVVPK